MAEKNKKDQTGEQEQDLSQILQVRRDKLAALQAAGKDPFQQTKFTVSAHAQEIKDHFEEMEGQPVTIAGRLMSKRGMGKVSFCDLQDKSGRIQLYARKDEMDEADYNEFKKYDIGDLVGVEGEVFRTQRGEMSVRCKQVTLLSKSLRPLPEKFHGLQDKELRYRQRYVDAATLKSAASWSAICGLSWTAGAIWRWKPPSSTPSPAGPPPGPSSPTTTPWTLTCTCALPRSST